MHATAWLNGKDEEAMGHVDKLFAAATRDEQVSLIQTLPREFTRSHCTKILKDAAAEEPSKALVDAMSALAEATPAKAHVQDA
eukprot:gene7034-6678_t